MKAQLFLKFVRYLKPYWGKELILLILMILTSVASLASPYILKIIIDTVFPSHNYSLLIQILLILLGINVFRLVISYSSDYLFTWIGNHVTRDIRMDLFRRLMQLPLSFFNKNKAGDLVHRVNSEVNSIQSILTGTVVRLINSTCSVIGLTVMLCILNWRLFLLSMAVMPFIFLNTRWFQPKIQKNIKKNREKDSDILSFLIERFSNIKLIKSYVRQSCENNKLLKKIEEQIGLNIRNVQLTATTRNITLLFTMLVPILIFGAGGKQVMAGTMTVGSLVAFIQYMNRIFDPFRDLMGFYFDAIRASVSMQRIFDLFEVKPENTEGEKDIPTQNDIIFRQVHFSYDRLSVLQEFSFTFRHGKKYALVGGSGCGKSTLTALLGRFYEPQSGNICIGDREIGKMNIHALRRRIALVTQDNQLFHESIGENIRYGKPDATGEEIEAAAIQANIAEHIHQLPDRFDTLIGDRGAGLSGGQQQRIAIARAILKDADVIILDEATSELDSDSEKNILEHLCRLYADKTMIVISHRLSAIRDMDEIVCMDQGKIIENGTHEELIGRKGFYWKLFKEQIE
ncbi:MAG: ABC transporter ATP-binding protein/permease [Tannerella sp.]|jgi:ABC-type multidrug transport system fused ATPase/permease subunit|nr:ABC transporter ATP-binding protein/permease [Tannerella sp.]